MNLVCQMESSNGFIAALNVWEGGEGKDGGRVMSHNRWSPTINSLPCISVVCISVNEDSPSSSPSPSPDPPRLGGTSCGSYKWSRGAVVAAISGPGDQLWRP